MSEQGSGETAAEGSLHSVAAGLGVPVPWAGSMNRVLGALPDTVQPNGFPLSHT